MLSINKFFQSPFILSMLIISCLIAGCSTDSGDDLTLIGTFNLEGFENQESYSLKQKSDFLLNGTELGLFARKINQDSWQNLVEENISIRSFACISENEIIASLYFNDQDSATIGITTNFGESWSSYRNGFDPVENSIPTIITRQEDTNTIYAGGSILRVAKSGDKAQSWEIVFGSWDGFGSIFFINSKKEVVWTGGSSAIFAPLLYRSKDNGVSWKEVLVVENGQDIVFDLTMRVQDSKIIMAGLGMGIRKSKDDGETWTTVHNESSIYTFTHSAQNPEIVYASGRNSVDRLFFLASGDFGDTWQTVEYPDSPAGIHVNDLISVMEDGNEVLYLGTNKGLYSFTFQTK